jgi:RNA polymerase sigma-70 factor (ECF subfamily)
VSVELAEIEMTMGRSAGPALAVEAVTPEAVLEQKFAAFVRTHRERARRLAWRLVGGDEAAADDVTQDALLKAYRALGRFREESSLETWFYRILVRQAHSYRRWRGVRELWTAAPTPAAADAGDLADPTPPAPGDPAVRRRIAASLDRLSRWQREAFVLVHLEGYTVREAAELLGKPEGTMKSHLHRALKSLRAQLADLATDDG